MKHKCQEPEAPEVLEAVLRRIRGMSREEWLKELTWRPDGAEETWRMQRASDGHPEEVAIPTPDSTEDRPRALDPAAPASPTKASGE